ncbi:ubiquinone/menaquinone biosynthesis C-methylase UbiE [Saccharothrix tamanrassetensis]|uniref:Ubiquinone/menaquinone biosynthesis C-methylase UbiE n=1 Tax=Saccharothrix tamanrassetensis TaxID=1051531 RepID=A0A841CWN0_9PSEU|nr:class I SAM-dependent methyltransferase [Saccharothrix tamanrassetensis]MBB5960407.1 ubiquinone/menaquinone biosynthesis C-methylase UbiE [Saccharothrix tamanrassetensis]
MIYEHPLAYLLGVEGTALLRAFTGEHDRDFVDARISEIRRLLDDEALANAAVDVDRLDTVDGYRVWSGRYDDPGNAAFDIDGPVVEEIVDALPVGVALDAACGTGRHARFLAERGHRVIGVDSSPDMLARARVRVPEGEFLLGDLHRLPVSDAEVDLVVCGLALTHIPALEPVVAEFARVLRPGGHLVISDVHPEAVARGSVPSVRGPDGRPGRLATYRHLVGDYLRAALPVGLRLRRCEEPRLPVRDEPGPPEPTTPGTVGPWELWPWCLADLVPEAARAANAGMPAMVVWHFQLGES